MNATTAFVGRVAARVLTESSVGVIATSGDPTSNLDNSLIGTDFRYVNNRLASGRSLEAEAWYQQSDSEGSIGDDAAFGLGLRMPNNSGLRGGLAMRRLEANFNPALGFVSNAGIDDYTAELGRTWRPTRGGPIQEVFAGLDTQRIEYLDDGSLQSQVLALRALELETRGRDQLRLRVYRSDEALRDPFEITDGVTIEARDYRFDEYELRIATGNQRKLSGTFEYRNGEFYDGERLRLLGAVAWRPNRFFRAAVEYEYNDVELPQADFIVRLARLTFESAFSPTLSWVNLIQYDNVSETIGLNSRVHWIPQAGREGFVVLNHNLDDEDRDNDFHSSYSELAVKFGYTFRF